MDLNEFKRELRKRETALRNGIKKAEGKSATAGKRIAQKLSSGPYSSEELAAMDHPYARRHGAAQIDPAVINAQSGAFRRDWKTGQGDWVEGSLLTTVENDNRVAKFMHGTKKMVPRPIEELTAKILEPVRNENLSNAIEKAIEGASK